MTNLVAVLVDDKIYPQIETDLKRYTTQYIQKKYENSKALVLNMKAFLLKTKILDKLKSGTDLLILKMMHQNTIISFLN